ncbi:MAG: mechanosensitive ion channel family protein [Acidobacteriota bacterium]|nr:mechanosensitive ion channel family protein [Acidobacteriota bacterium]
MTYGEIDHIGLRSTKLTTPDNTRVTIPNSDILSGKVWNANSGVLDCQVVTDLFLPIDTDPVTATEIGYEAAYSSPFILLSKPVVVLVQDAFDQRSFLRLRVKEYVYDHRFEPRFQSDITMRAKAEFLNLRPSPCNQCFRERTKSGVEPTHSKGCRPSLSRSHAPASRNKSPMNIGERLKKCSSYFAALP